VNIGIIGSGNMGASMGHIWAKNGHKVLFSFCKDQEKLRAVAAAAGANARADARRCRGFRRSDPPFRPLDSRSRGAEGGGGVPGQIVPGASPRQHNATERDKG